jgi:hypothetical protein
MSKIETIEAHYMGKVKIFKEDEVKTIWDASKIWSEITKNDPDESYLYKYPGVSTLYVKYNSVKLPISTL